jgi:hypothetical protein
MRMPISIKNTFFFLGLGTLFTHELDAISSYEWRLLPILGSLPDQMGMTIFVLMHIPLFAGIVALVASSNEQTRGLSRITVSGFLLIHAALHIWFSSDPNYGFVSNVSNWLIFGGAGLGAIYLALTYREYRISIVQK